MQAFVLKYLLFFPEESIGVAPYMHSIMGITRVYKDESVAAEIFSTLSEGKKSRS